MHPTATLILNHHQILQKINRMAYEIYEHNLDARTVIFAGISGKGAHFAQLLQKKFDEIADLPSVYFAIPMDKHNLQEPINIGAIRERVKDSVVIVADDVLNTGKTLIYALQPFLEEGAVKIETAILADRNHKQFPVHVNYVGTSIATTLQEHISLEIKPDGEMSVYLV